MSKFRSFRRCLRVVAFVALEVNLGLTLLGKSTHGVMQMFLTIDEFVVGVKGAFDEFNARGIDNLCHIELELLLFFVNSWCFGWFGEVREEVSKGCFGGKTSVKRYIMVMQWCVL